MSEPETKPETTPATEPSKEGFHKKLSVNPFFIVYTVIFGIILGVAGTYFGYIAIKETKLTYSVSATRVPILQKGSMDSLSVTYMGFAITNDLSSAEVTIQNEGDEPVRKADILRPVTINFLHGEPIFKISQKTSRPEVSCKILNVTNSPSGTVSLDWNILEKGDTLTIQIVYGGNVNSTIQVSGIVVGQPKGITIIKDVRDSNFMYMLTAFQLVGMLLVFYTTSKINRMRLGINRTARFLFFLMGILMTATFSVSVYGIFYLLTKHNNMGQIH